MLKDINTRRKDRLSWPIRRYAQPTRTGGNAHRALVQEAIDFLRGRGFTDNEIYTEFAIETEQPGHFTPAASAFYTTRARCIDVVGIKPNKRIAIECGSPGQPELISPFFDEVLHFPFK